MPLAFSLLLVTAGLPGTAQEASAVPSVGPEAEHRLAELAGRYAGGGRAAGAEAQTQSQTQTETATQTAADIEQTPLGFSANRPGDAAGRSEPTGGWVLSTCAALGVVIGLILAARWAYTKMGGKVIARSSPAVEVLSRTTVAPKNHVLLLRVGQRVLVVSDSGAGLRTLANLDDPEEVASVLQSVTSQQPASVTKSFNGLVTRFNGEYDAKSQLAEEGGDESEITLDRTRDALSGLKSRLQSLSNGGNTA
ncbi:MAG: flagellar biosynthetic protein FliO [Planctomycetota bacterium]